MMSVLVLLVGSIRGSTDAWDSLFRNVLDVNSARWGLAGRRKGAWCWLRMKLHG